MGEVSKKYMQECESLKSQLSQQEKAYATLMDQLNKLQAEKNNLQDEADRLRHEKKELQDINNCNRDVIHKWEETSAKKDSKIAILTEENKKLLEKLDAAEKELEKANTVFKNEFEKRSSLQRQYDEIKIKNQNICSSIADLVRKVMQE